MHHPQQSDEKVEVSSTSMTDDQQQQLSQLELVQSLIELERSLTDAIELADPWVLGKTRPYPPSMTDVNHVLHIARKLASRTSAPAGWNPHAPVIGFATPNPMPHQLRGGALGTLQLELARVEQEVSRKRKHHQQQARMAANKADTGARNKVEPMTSTMSNTSQVQNAAAAAATTHATNSNSRPRATQQVLAADMNLSDSSSSEEEDDDE